jgi:cytochrome P450
VDRGDVVVGAGAARLRTNAAPGPRGYPLIGVFPRARRDPLGFFLDTARRYGDVVSMRFGARRVYLLNHPDDVRHVLQDSQRVYRKGPPATRVRPLFGDSLTTVDGERWRRQRRLMRPAFHATPLLRVLPIITETTAELLDRWRRLAERGEAIDALSEMRGLTRAIILRVLFGDVDPVQARTVGQALEFALEYADRRLWSPLGWLDLPTPGHRRFRQALLTVDRFVSDVVERARRGAPPPGPGTLLSALLTAHDAASGDGMRGPELQDELKALLVAGHTTTASALGWTWYVLSQNPEARQRLHRELRLVLDDRLPGPNDLPALRYTRMLIDEVLRLYPPTWVTARMPLSDDGVRGYRISGGSIVLLSPYVTHRHPSFWEDPDRFDPERFTPERAAGRPRFAYFPFGGGPRSCIGSWLALVEMQLVVAMVARRHELTLAPGSRVDVHPGLTLRASPGIPMLLR